MIKCKEIQFRKLINDKHKNNDNYTELQYSEKFRTGTYIMRRDLRTLTPS